MCSSTSLWEGEKFSRRRRAAQTGSAGCVVGSRLDPRAVGQWFSEHRSSAGDDMHEHLNDERRDPFRPRGARIDAELPAHAGPAAAAGRSDVLDPESLLGLQRSVGNAGVSSLLEEERSPVHDVISSGGRPLEPDTRAEMESRLGYDFSDVRVHDDSAASASAKAVNAHAYTVGSNVVFQRDRYDPGSHEGKVTLAHELTHVVQQRSGPVEGTSV